MAEKKILEITNLTQNIIDEKFFQEIAAYVLSKEKKQGLISLVLVGPGRIKKLNRQYRKKNKVTDVLSFPAKAEVFVPKDDKNFLGEIVVCLRVVKKTSRRENIPFEEELARVFIHGILHILGYDHLKPEEEKVMIAKQEKYLEEILKKVKWQNQ
ncbi:rRNA maturation RNase YbeY [bacterium]|nr:rRNA maturation RNase YbeY [bacterium]